MGAAQQRHLTRMLVRCALFAVGLICILPEHDQPQLRYMTLRGGSGADDDLHLPADGAQEISVPWGRPIVGLQPRITVFTEVLV